MKKMERQHRRSARTVSVSPHQVDFIKRFDVDNGLSKGLLHLCQKSGYKKEAEYDFTKESSPPFCNGEGPDTSTSVEQII